jgi:hypothetical protein
MLEIICPRCGNTHHSDEVHVGKLLRCAKCGDAVQIASHSSQSPVRPIDKKVHSPVGKLFKDAVKTPLKTKGIARWVFMCGLLFLVGILGTYNFVQKKKTQDILDRIARDNAEERNRLRAENDLARPVDDLHPRPITDNEKPQVSLPHTLIKPQTPRTLLNGTRIRGDAGTDGRGILAIVNHAGDDAVVKLISVAKSRTIRFVFIQKSSTVTLPEIPPGSYKIRFCFGSDWDPAFRRFTNIYSYFEFGKELNFDETHEDNGIRYTREEITLNTVFNGNVPRKEIQKDIFDSE